MVTEFERFKIPQYRQLTGYLQLMGGLGLIIGLYFYVPLAFVSTIGLALLMFLGFGVRMKINDGVLKSLPALLFGVLNAYLVFRFFSLM